MEQLRLITFCLLHGFDELDYCQNLFLSQKLLQSVEKYEQGLCKNKNQISFRKSSLGNSLAPVVH